MQKSETTKGLLDRPLTQAGFILFLAFGTALGFMAGRNSVNLPVINIVRDFDAICDGEHDVTWAFIEANRLGANLGLEVAVPNNCKVDTRGIR